MVNYGLKDKVALITGANNPQGIGATTALSFAREGAKVKCQRHYYQTLFLKKATATAPGPAWVPITLPMVV